MISRMRSYLLGGVIGALALYLALDLDPVSFPEVIVPAPRILAAEPPPPKLVERVRYIYLQPDIRAVAQGGAVADAVQFCRPQLVPVAEVAPTQMILIRTATHKPAWLPFQRDRLVVTSMDGSGDLFLEDYSVRPGFRASFEYGVLYPRSALAAEAIRGLGWYLMYRGVEAIFH